MRIVTLDANTGPLQAMPHPSSPPLPLDVPAGKDDLAAAREGDQQAFARLVRAHQAMVFSLARHIVGVAAVAEEVAQEVFCQLFLHLEQIVGERHLLFWLRQTATRRALDQWRRARLRRCLPLAEIAAPPAPASSRDPWLEQRLHAALADLRPEQRAVIALRYQEGLEPGEIAALLGAPLLTIKSRLQRGLRRLRRALAAPAPGSNDHE